MVMSVRGIQAAACGSAAVLWMLHEAAVLCNPSHSISLIATKRPYAKPV